MYMPIYIYYVHKVSLSIEYVRRTLSKSRNVEEFRKETSMMLDLPIFFCQTLGRPFLTGSHVMFLVAGVRLHVTQVALTSPPGGGIMGRWDQCFSR